MSPTLLLLVPPFALLVWRGDWPSALALVAVVLLVAYLDWRVARVVLNDSVSMDIYRANHAIKLLTARVDAATESRALDAASLTRVDELGRRLKSAEESLERHAQLLAKQGQRSGGL